MLSERIKTLRKKKGMSQEELALELHVVRQTISKWENALSVPDADELIHLAETLLLQIWAHLQSIPADNLYLFALVGVLCGCYFWIFAKEKIPAYYDQNKVTAYSDGVFHMNLVGTSINNSNWKYILQVGRIWSVACMVVLPLLYFLLKVFLSDIMGRTGEYILIAIWVSPL